MKENILIDKSIAFASRIIKLHQYLIKTKKETINRPLSVGFFVSSVEQDTGSSLLPFIANKLQANRKNALTPPPKYGIIFFVDYDIHDSVHGHGGVSAHMCALSQTSRCALPQLGLNQTKDPCTVFSVHGLFS